MEGLNSQNKLERIRLTPENSKALNCGFDVTPARLITGLITNKGICKATSNDIQQLLQAQ